MRWILIILAIPVMVFAWDFSQERNTIPVYFDSVKCQVPWTTGYNYLHPTFCDIDGDGDFDLFFGSDFGRLSYFQNNGDSANLDMTFITDNLITIPINPESQIPNRPAFCDIDNDGDFDLFVGTWQNISPIWYGRMYFYRNIGTNNNPNFFFEDSLFQGIENPNLIHPYFVDIDNDNDFDLFLGVRDNLAYYRNEGTASSASMILISNNFINISLGGYKCIPSFTDIDADGDYDMFLGDEDGNIHYFRNDSTPQNYNFVLVSQQYQGINVGRIASPAFCDIDGDGDYDLFVGERSWGEDNRHGDIDFYENIGRPDSAVFVLRTQNFIGIDIGLSPHPSFADIDNDGLKDMFLGDIDGNINYFLNSGSLNSPSFHLAEERFQNIAANYRCKPSFGDIDGDGDLDMVAGRVYFNTGSIHFYRNQGTPENLQMILESTSYLGIDYQLPLPKFVDIDSDGDLDILVGHAWNQVVFWETVGNPLNPAFIMSDSSLFNTPYEGAMMQVCYGDLDGDGDLDAVRGQPDEGPPNYYGSYLDYYRNDGTPFSPNFVLAEPHFLGISLVKYAEPFLEDIDNDGDLDLFVGDGPGGVSFGGTMR